MTLRYRLATPEDFPAILAMLRAFYAEDRIDYDAALVEPGLRALLAEPAPDTARPAAQSDRPAQR